MMPSTPSAALPLTPLLDALDSTLRREVDRYAAAFAAGLAPGEAVLLCGIAPAVALPVTLGAWWAGHPVALLDPATPPQALGHAVERVGPALRVGRPLALPPEAEGEWLAEGDGLPTWCARHSGAALPAPATWRDDRCALVLFTSGSTGRPKGVCHSLGNMVRSAQAFCDQFLISAGDRLLNLAPLHTMSGARGSLLVPLLSGCTLLPAPAAPTLAEVVGALERSRPSVMISGPVLVRQMAMLAARLKPQLGVLRAILCTGARLDRASRVALLKECGVPVVDYYGLTETSGLVIAESIADYDPQASVIGRAIPGVRLELVAVEGMSGEGQLRIRSPNLFLGYLGGPLARRDHLDTGDIARIDERGGVELLGRIDRGVKSASTQWIYPEVLERFLVAQPGVVDAHVVSAYDPYGRGELHAELVTEGAAWDAGRLAALAESIARALGTSYRPATLQCVSGLARSPLGKRAAG